MKLYFAGAQTPHIRDSYKSVGVSDMLFNFHYMDGVESLAEFQGLNIFLDSGASILEESSYSDEEYDSILENYINFLDAYIEYIDVALEIYRRDNDTWWMDARESLVSRFGDKILPVAYCTKDDDYSYYKNYSYIALGKMKTLSEYRRVMGGVNFIESGVKFHALGMSDPDMLLKGNFYSADTYAPLLGGKFKAYYHYKGKNSIKRVADVNTAESKRESFRKSVKNSVVGLGIDWTEFSAEEYRALNAWNAAQWLQFSKDLDTSTYYASPEEQKELVAIARQESGVVAIRPTQSLVSQGQTYALDPTLGISRQCNTCSMKAVCPVFTPDSACTLEQYVHIEGPDDVLKAFNHILMIQMNRVTMAAAQERMSGDTVSAEVTEQMKATTDMLESYRRTAMAVNDINISASGKGVSVLGALLENLVRPGVAAHGAGPQYGVRSAVSEKREAIRSSIRETEEMESEIIDAEIVDEDLRKKE